MARRTKSAILKSVHKTSKGLRKAGAMDQHTLPPEPLYLSGRDAAAFAAALLDDAPPFPRLIRAAQAYLRRSDVIARATEVFGDAAKAQTWLDRENRALSGSTPRSLLSTEAGCERVLTVLGQIEHGVY